MSRDMQGWTKKNEGETWEDKNFVDHAINGMCLHFSGDRFCFLLRSSCKSPARCRVSGTEKKKKEMEMAMKRWVGSCVFSVEEGER